MTYDRSSSPLYELLLRGTPTAVAKGQVIGIFEDVPKLHLLKSGYIKRYMITNEGKKSIQVIYGPGDIFPLTPVYKTVFEMDMYSGPEHYYYEAMTPLEVFSIRDSQLADELVGHPEMFKDLFYAAGLRLDSYIHRLESMSSRLADKALSHVLLYLAHAFGEPVGDGHVRIQLKLTHQTLSEILNLARETVSIRMAELIDAQLISVDGHYITVTDVEKLQDFSS